MANKIKLLGISGSPRKGNSYYILEKAIESTKGLDYEIESQIYSLRGKKIQACIGCFRCNDNQGQCILKDDFEELRQLWIEADAILYSFPVYHLSIPGQLKSFIDRLGNCFYGYYQVGSMRHMKVIGAFCQGMHYFGGQELATSFIIQHAVLQNSLPVAGDGWQSYIGANGWTGNNPDRKTIKKLDEAGDKEAQITLTAAQSVAKRVVEMAAIIKAGSQVNREKLSKDIRYSPYFDRMDARENK